MRRIPMRSRLGLLAIVLLGTVLSSGCGWMVVGGAIGGFMAIDNLTAEDPPPDPVEVDIEHVGATQSGLVYVPYRTRLGDGSPFSIVAEYSIYGSGVWIPATAGPGTSALYSDGGTGRGVFVWDSRRDRVRSRNVEFRLQPTLAVGMGGADTANFYISNNTTDEWMLMADELLLARCKLACSAVDGKIYAMGGGLTTAFYSIVEVFDPIEDSWTLLPDMPTARDGLTSQAAYGRIFAMGGDSGGATGACEEYDPQSQTWAVRAPMPTPRFFLSSAVVDGRIVTVGGSSGASSYLDTVEIYDPLTSTWSTGAVMPTPRSNHGCVAAGGRVYAFGGWDATGSLDAVEAYDPLSNTWDTGLAPMPAPRSGFTAHLVGGKIYVIGGYNFPSYYSDLLVYDPLSDTWEDGYTSSMLNQKSYVSGAMVGGKIYVVGGKDNSEFYGNVERYTPATETWTLLNTLPTPSKAHACAGAAGHLYVTGGHDGTFYLDSNLEYDPSGDTWVSRMVMPWTRAWHGTASYDGKVYVFGGSDGTSNQTTVASYDPGTDGWTARTPMITARSDFACAAANGFIYVAGGNPGPLSSVEAYDPETDTWKSVPSMALPRESARSVGLNNGSLLVSGGRVDFLTYLDSTISLEPGQSSWTSFSAMPGEKSGFAMSRLRGSILAVGGWNAGWLSSTYEYDPGRDTWSTGPSMPINPWQHACGTLQGRLYSFGGEFLGELDTIHSLYRERSAQVRSLHNAPAALSSACLLPAGNSVILTGGSTPVSPVNSATYTTQLTHDVNTYNRSSLARATWTSRTAAPVSRSKQAWCERNGILYLLGGFDASWNATASVMSYDPDTDAWTSLPDMPTARAALGAVCLGDKIYAFGGDTGLGAVTGVLEVFDVPTGAWEAGPYASLTVPRYSMAFGFEGRTGRILVFGGEGSGGATLGSVEAYDLAQGVWIPRNDLPEPLEGALCLYEGGSLKIFGGEYSTSKLSNRILDYDPVMDAYSVENAVLPYAARDLFGCTLSVTWDHHGESYRDEICVLGGGWNILNRFDGFFRFYTR